MLPNQIAQASKSKVKIRKNKPQVRQYGINPKLKQWEEIEFPMVVPEVAPVYQEALDYYLKGNPFLHSLDSNFDIKTIEEYYCFYKNEYILMGDLIRSGQYSRFRQRKILKNNFKLWKKDYSQDKHETIKVVESTFTMIGQVDFKIFGIFKRLFLTLGFIFMVSLIYNQSNLFIRIFGVSRGQTLYDNFNTFLNNYLVLKKILNISIYAIVGAFLYFKFMDTVFKDYLKNYDNAQKILTNSKSILNREFKKKTRRVQRYYLTKVIKKPDRYLPLKIEHVCQTKVNLKDFQNISNTIVVKGAQIKKNNWLYDTFRYIFVGLSFIGMMSLFVLIIYIFIKDIFF